MPPIAQGTVPAIASISLPIAISLVAPFATPATIPLIFPLINSTKPKGWYINMKNNLTAKSNAAKKNANITIGYDIQI